MIAKGKSITHTSIAVDYARLKESATELDRLHLSGDTGAEIEQQFRMCQNLNGNCKNNTLQFVISPTIEDGQRLKQSEFREIYREFIQKMNLQEHQSVAFLHKDQAHTHIHIYANRIDFNGQAYNDSYISNRSAQMAEEIAIQRNLTTARQVQETHKLNNKHTIDEIKARHEITMKHKPQNLNDYIELMKASKVNVHVVKSKTGRVSGLRMEFAGQSFKASEIDRNLSFKRLSEQIERIAPKIAENLNLGVKIASKGVKTGRRLARGF